MSRELTPIYEAVRPNASVYEQQLRLHLALEKLELQRLLLAKSVKTQKMIEPLVLMLWKSSNEELVNRLRDENPFARWFAADILSRRQIHVEKQIMRLLEDPYLEVRSGARQALVRLARGTDFGPSPHDSRSTVQEAIRHWENWLVMQEATLGGRSRAESSPGKGARTGERPK